MKKLLCAVLLSFSAAGVHADLSEAIEAKAEAMRAAWRASPSRPVGITVPVYERVMAFNMLRGFVPAYENVNGDFYMMEFVPDGETVENWTQMVTVTAQSEGADPMLDHITQASQTFDTLTGCENGLYFRELGERKVHANVSAVIINRGCAKVAENAYQGAKPMGEQNLILHFRDGRDVYTLQYAVREPFKKGKRPFADNDVIPMLANFGAVTLCPDQGACEGALTLP